MEVRAHLLERPRHSHFDVERVKAVQDEQARDDLVVPEPVDQPAKIAEPVAVAVLERLDVQLVDDRILEPVGV